MPKDDEALQTLSETIADLEKLPELASGRIWLNAFKAIQAESLVTEHVEGPEEYERLVPEAMITIGALSDGKARIHVYPTGTATDELASRDAVLEAITALKGPRGDVTKLVDLAKRKPSTTFAVMVRAHADTRDGPVLVEFLRHPDVSRSVAVGLLKLAVEFIRNQDDAGDGKN